MARPWPQAALAIATLLLFICVVSADAPACYVHANNQCTTDASNTGGQITCNNIGLGAVAQCRDACNALQDPNLDPAKQCKSFQYYPGTSYRTVLDGFCCLMSKTADQVYRGGGDCPGAQIYDFPCTFNTSSCQPIEALHSNCTLPAGQGSNSRIYSSTRNGEGTNGGVTYWTCLKLCAQAESNGLGRCRSFVYYPNDIDYEYPEGTYPSRRERPDLLSDPYKIQGTSNYPGKGAPLYSGYCYLHSIPARDAAAEYTAARGDSYPAACGAHGAAGDSNCNAQNVCSNANFFDYPCGVSDCFSPRQLPRDACGVSGFSCSVKESFQSCRDLCAVDTKGCNSFIYNNASSGNRAQELGDCCLQRNDAPQAVNYAAGSNTCSGQYAFGYPCTISGSTTNTATATSSCVSSSACASLAASTCSQIAQSSCSRLASTSCASFMQSTCATAGTTTVTLVRSPFSSHVSPCRASLTDNAEQIV